MKNGKRTRCRWHNSLRSFAYYVDWWFCVFVCVTHNTYIGSTNNKVKYITIKLWLWRIRLSIFVNYSPFHLRVLRDLVVMSYKTNTSHWDKWCWLQITIMRKISFAISNKFFAKLKKTFFYATIVIWLPCILFKLDFDFNI